jgi:hypothetical protein
LIQSEQAGSFELPACPPVRLWKFVEKTQTSPLMFSQRWSTFTLLSLVLTVALSAFYGGRLSLSGHSTSPENTPRPPEKQNPQTVFGRPAQVINSDVPSKTENLEDRWGELSAQPRTPADENEMAGLIEKMAESDPQRAIALAAAQTNLRLRAALLRAALKGWGTTDPEAAAKWAQSETVMDRGQAINALLQGAVQDPDKAVSVTTELTQNDSSRAGEFGADLISALTEAGQFDRAANFAVNSPANCREDLMLPAYSRWAEFQPQAAFASAALIADPDLRDTALNAIIVGWSPTDPQGMVEFAQNNLSAGQQDSALSRAIGFWAGSDPIAAATWINQNNPGPQSDTGVAEIALSPQLAQTPELAANWAESISNPQLRLETLATVVRNWAAANLSGAENYVENTPELAPEDRPRLLAELTSQSAP